MLINSANLRTLQTGFQTTFNTAFAQAPSSFEQVAMVVPSSTDKETYAWLGQSTQFKEWIGERQYQNIQAYDYALKNKTFTNDVKVPVEAIEDDTYGVYSPLMAQMGMQAKTHPDQLIFSLMKNGFSQACYDGQYFFDTDHPVGSGTASNSGGGSGTPWFLLDVSQMVKPFIFQRRKDYQFITMDKPDDETVYDKKLIRYSVDCRVNAGYGLWQMAYGSKQTLDATNYAAARTAMQSLTNDAGNPLAIRPNLLVVPPSLEAAALQILNAEMVSNTTNVWRGTAGLLVSPWLV